MKLHSRGALPPKKCISWCVVLSLKHVIETINLSKVALLIIILMKWIRECTASAGKLHLVSLGV